MAHWHGCVPCRLLSDATTLTPTPPSYASQGSLQLAPDGPASFPWRLRPLHERLSTPVVGGRWHTGSIIYPESALISPHRLLASSPSVITTRFGGLGLKHAPYHLWRRSLRHYASQAYRRRRACRIGITDSKRTGATAVHATASTAWQVDSGHRGGVSGMRTRLQL